MDELEDLKKKLHCEKCHEKYSEESKPFVHDRCEHHTCHSCLKYDPYSYSYCYRCPVCDISTEITEASDVSIAVEMYELSMKNRDEVEKELGDEISKLKQEKAQWEEERNHECVDCGAKDSEQKMYLCRSCTTLELKDAETYMKDVEKHSLCSNCAIRNHMLKEHETVDFFPYLSAHQYWNFWQSIAFKPEKCENFETTLEKHMKDFKVLSECVSKKVWVLMSIARKSKSSKYQIEAIERMELFVEKLEGVIVKMNSELKENAKIVQENITKLDEWFATRKDSCVDKSQLIELPCSIL